MLLIVDGNNVAWAGFFAVGRSMGLETEERRKRAAFVGLAQSVLGLAVRGGEPPGTTVRPGALSTVAIAFDQGRPLRRRERFPAYQTGREATPSFVDNEPAVTAAIDLFIDAARFMPFTVLQGVNTEADDLAAALALQAEGDVRIASTDRDFLQLVDGRISIYSTVKRRVIAPDNFAEEACPADSGGRAVAFPRERYLEYRMASGDTSDDLPGIPGVGALTAARLVARNPLEAYLDDVALVTSVLGRRNVRLEGAVRSGEARAVVERNRQLMDLRAAAAGYPSLDRYSRVGRWAESEFRAWFADQRLGMTDIDAVVPALEALAGGA